MHKMQSGGWPYSKVGRDGSLIPRPPPSFPSLAIRKSGRGPVIFSHVSDVRRERMVERV